MILAGTMADGREVQRIEIGAGELTAAFFTKGATLRSLRLEGVAHDLTLGSDVLADNDGPLRYFGTLVAPVANRIRDARAVIAGAEHRFTPNQSGRHILHSADGGSWSRLWAVTDHGPAHVTMALDLADGLAGFPGNRHLTVTFTALPPATLRMEVTATTDAATLMNVANHSYWALDGAGSFAGQSLRIAAENYLPVDAETLPTGAIAPVAGSDFDFREGRVLVPGAPALDHNFCLSDGPRPLREVLWLRGRSGVAMAVATTAPGVQVYDAGHTVGPGGAIHEGLAIEPQGWPDAPTHAAFPQIALNPGEVWRQMTEWRFTR